MIRHIVLVAAAVLIVSLIPGSVQADAPASPPSDSARGWHITGKWVGKKDYTRKPTRMRIWRSDSGVVKGTAFYKYSTDSCRSKLRQVKVTKQGWHIFKERIWYDPSDYCSSDRLRMHKWPNGRLKAVWPNGVLSPEAILRRP